MELVVGQKYKVKYLGPDYHEFIGRTFEAVCELGGDPGVDGHMFRLPMPIGCSFTNRGESNSWLVKVIGPVENETESDDGSEIRSGLKTHEMFKLSDEFPNILIKREGPVSPNEKPHDFYKPNFFEEIFYLSSMWSVKILPKKVSFTRKEFIQIHSNLHRKKWPNIKITPENDEFLQDLLKELGL